MIILLLIPVDINTSSSKVSSRQVNKPIMKKRSKLDSAEPQPKCTTSEQNNRFKPFRELEIRTTLAFNIRSSPPKINCQNTVEDMQEDAQQL